MGFERSCRTDGQLLALSQLDQSTPPRGSNASVAKFVRWSVSYKSALTFRSTAASTPEEWNDTGRYLFQKTLFAQAASCFEKANRPQDRDISMAYQKRKDARRLASGRDRRAAFKAAGEAFTACGSSAIVRDEAKSYHTLAEQCFNEAGEADLAAHARAAALDETEAAIVYRDIRDFDNALKLIIRPKTESSRVRPDIAKEIIELARWEFLANSQRYA